MRIKAEEIKKGMGIKTWMGTHTVIGVIPYDGPFDFIIGIMKFSNGNSMSIEAGHLFELAE